MKKHTRKDREERRRDEREQSPDRRSRSRAITEITDEERRRERSRLGRPRDSTANRGSSSWYPDRSRFTLNLRSESRRLSPRRRHDEGNL